MQLTRSSLRSVRAAPQRSQVRLVHLRAATESVQTSTNGVSAPTIVASNGLAFEDLSEIVRLVQDTDIVDFELKSKKFHLSVRKREAVAAELAAAQAAASPMQYAPMPMAAPAPAPMAAPAPAPAAAASAPAPAPKAAAPAAPKGVEVTSPMAGTLYRSAAPGEAPFIKEGDMVKKGQTVCIIEAMKLMNEIEAEISGEVVKILADNGSQVSPGQPLLLIRPQ